MRITQCDVCKKKIEGDPVTGGIGIFPKTELCKKCGAPILRFLVKHRLLESKNIIKGKTRQHA